MENKQKLSDTQPHNIELLNRKQLCITGVIEVISATANLINLSTSQGSLSIAGTDLKIKNLNNADKILSIEGTINEIKYNQKKRKFFEKAFK